MNPWVSVSHVISTVSVAFNEPGLTTRKTRRQSMCWWVVYYLAYRVTGSSLPEIARVCRAGDHTSVMHGLRRLNDLMGSNPMLKSAVQTLEEKLKAHVPEEYATRPKVRA